MSSSDEMNISGSKDNLAAYFALQCGLETMKERCVTIQNRLSQVEEENVRLRMLSGIDKPDISTNGDNKSFGSENEVEVLREKIGELTRQKLQLTDHIAMVASENRQLWSRLSKLTKDSQINKIKEQTLIRSKTFTQNNPNPKLLRLKLNSTDSSTDEVDFDLRDDDLKNNSIGYGYLQNQMTTSNGDDEIIQDVKNVTECLTEMKKEMLRQQSDMKVALSNLRKNRVMEVCNSCKNKDRHTKKAIADKSLSTDDELKLENVPLTDDENTTTTATKEIEEERNIDFGNKKRLADLLEKMCPMCGKIYEKTKTFDEFQDHVESHFIDPSEIDFSIERNFEIISHSVGDF